VKNKTAGRVFRRAASTAFLLVVVSNAPLGAVEPSAGDSESLEAAACEMQQASLSLPVIAAGGELQPLDLGLRPTLEAPATQRVHEPIVGIASFYDYPQETASGEPYDPKAFTAAAQLEIRGKFGGISFGTLYQPAYAIAEYRGKKLIIKFNDVGPLVADRKFDLSRAAMEYFDGVEKGLLEGFKVTPLPLGQIYATGPVTDADLIALGIAKAPAVVAQAPSAEPPVLVREPASTSADAEPQPEPAPDSPYTTDDFVPAPIGDVADLSVAHDG